MGYAPKIEIGTKFNHWQVLSYNKERQRYLCECVCKTKRFVRSDSLKLGKSKSCGCRQKESVGIRILNSEFKSIKHKIYDNYVKAAKRRGYIFELSEERFTQLLTQNCYYCGAEPYMIYSYGRGKNQALDYTLFKYNGVDRIDNSIGYTDDNCVPCCKFCNNTKSTYGDEWLHHILRIYQFQVTKGTFNDYPARE